MHAEHTSPTQLYTLLTLVTPLSEIPYHHRAPTFDGHDRLLLHLHAAQNRPTHEHAQIRSNQYGPLPLRTHSSLYAPSSSKDSCLFSARFLPPHANTFGMDRSFSLTLQQYEERCYSSSKNERENETRHPKSTAGRLKVCLSDSPYQRAPTPGVYISEHNEQGSKRVLWHSDLAV